MSYKACPLHINHGLASVVYTMFREVTVGNDHQTHMLFSGGI